MTNRSILDIIIACQDQQPATVEELRLTVMAVAAMMHFEIRAHRRLIDDVLSGTVTARMRAEFNKQESEIRSNARKLTPQAYLGPEHTPGTPENERLKAAAKAVVKKVTGEDL